MRGIRSTSCQMTRLKIFSLQKNLIIFFCFSFEQEENEMKMMNCICDEDEEEDQISSESPDSSPSPIENGSKIKSSSRFLKSRPVKVQRSASSIIRSKMYQVIKKKKKPSKGTTIGNKHAFKI